MAKPANSEPLTKRQQAIHDYVKSFVLAHGYGPSIREIGAHFGIASPNGVAGSLRAIEKKGAMKRATKNGRQMARAYIFPSE